MLRYVLISMLLGIATETGARLLGLWRYRSWVYPILNVVVVFGIVMGTLAMLVATIGLLPACGAALLFGLAYEAANLVVLKWWHFPGERLAFIHGHGVIVVVLGILWGLVPLITSVAATTLPGRPAAHDPLAGLTGLDRVRAQEKRLIEALELTQQKERTLRNRLEHVRRKKRALLERQGGGRPAAGTAQTAAPGDGR